MHTIVVGLFGYILKTLTFRMVGCHMSSQFTPCVVGLATVMYLTSVAYGKTFFGLQRSENYFEVYFLTSIVQNDIREIPPQMHAIATPHI